MARHNGETYLERLIRASAGDTDDLIHGALAPGDSESSTGGQYIKAIAYWQALLDSGDPDAEAYATTIRRAVAALRARYARI